MAVFIAITPVFLIITGGYYCRSRQFVDDNFWRGAEKITYFLMLPALLISKMSAADISQLDFLSTAAIVGLALMITSLLLLMCKAWLGLDNLKFSSIFQGGIRFNTYIGLAVVTSLYGTDGLVIAVIVTAIAIPIINILCIFVLEYYSDNESEDSKKRLFYSIIKNPLIVACVIGMAINISEINLPTPISEMLKIFSSAALPLGLLTVGAALNIRSIKSAVSPIVIASTAKFFILPLVAMVLCYGFGAADLVQQVLLIFFTLPTATASYVLAKQLGGDAELMATIITAETFLALFIMPLLLSLFPIVWRFF